MKHLPHAAGVRKVDDKQVSSVPKNRRVNAQASGRGPLRRFHAALALALLLASLSLSINAARVSSQARSAEEKTNSAAQPKGKTAFDGERAFAHVRRLVGFGPRPAGSKELAEARKYIV
ncbi:MAG TPA: hypothetical protein VE713_00195, partial [Pyrinomonadaceae bacterium]|nr:hypothetical protein [Pyrinomonadaceae bacterium]